MQQNRYLWVVSILSLVSICFGYAENVTLTAIPFYCQDNREDTGRMEVWLPEKKELAKPILLPTIANQSKISVSHCFQKDTENAFNDGIEPDSSNDHSIPRHTWWDHRGTTEWVQYEFDRTRKVSSVSVYWWDDRLADGDCAVPESWCLSYRSEDGQWKHIPGNIHYGIRKDQYNKVIFKTIQTEALRLEAKLFKRYSCGILEWKVG